MLTKVQIKSILILLDNEGHAEWQIADILKVKDSNLNPKLKKLEKQGIIYQGESRPSSRPKKKEGDYKEFPYFLSNNLEGLKRLIKEIAKLRRVFEAFFILEIIENSKYIESMVKRFGEEVNKTVELALNEDYPAYSDAFFNKFVKQHLLCDLWDCTPIIEVEKRLNWIKTHPKPENDGIAYDIVATILGGQRKEGGKKRDPYLPWQIKYLEILIRNDDIELLEKLMHNSYMESNIRWMYERMFYSVQPKFHIH